jgi:hypothetical protein
MSEFDWIPPIRVKMNAKHKAIAMPDWCKKRYQDAHDKSFSDIIKKDGLNFNAKIPDTNKANGLTQAVIKFLNWSGHNADRTSTQGRMIRVNGVYKRISSANRKGTSDISVTMKGGRSAKLEIKIKPDKPSIDQLKEQAREQAVGGCYEFIYSFENFILWYDNFILIL